MYSCGTSSFHYSLSRRLPRCGIAPKRGVPAAALQPTGRTVCTDEVATAGRVTTAPRAELAARAAAAAQTERARRPEPGRGRRPARRAEIAVRDGGARGVEFGRRTPPRRPRRSAERDEQARSAAAVTPSGTRRRPTLAGPPMSGSGRHPADAIAVPSAPRTRQPAIHRIEKVPAPKNADLRNTTEEIIDDSSTAQSRARASAPFDGGDKCSLFGVVEHIRVGRKAHFH